MGAVGAIGFALAIIFMVMFHEFGHYVMAKRYGMKVTEFFFGFGPKLWSYRPRVRKEVRSGDGSVTVVERASETEYGVKAIPAGGYVKIVGMNLLEEVPPEDEARTFRGKSARQKLVVLVAGSATHFITALVLFFLIFSVVGWRQAVPVLDEVVSRPGGVQSPAQIADLRPGDRIVSVNGTPVSDWGQVSEFISAHGGREVTFGIQRGGQVLEKRLELAQRDDGKGFLGVVAANATVREPVHVGLWRSVQVFFETGYNSVRAFVAFFSLSNLSNYFRLLAGDETTAASEDSQNRPVSLVGAGRIASQVRDPSVYLGLIATLMMFVGIVNLLPLYPLDGGWVAVIVYEKVASRLRRRPVSVDPRKLVTFGYAVLTLLGFLFITSLYLDITSPIMLNL